MITDDELIRLLELADPARVDDPAPVLEPAEYRDALLRAPVTLVDREPTPSEPRSGRRSLTFIAAAAAVVLAIVLAAIHDADDATPSDQPSVPPRALPNSPRNVAPLAPGTYFVDEVDGTPTARIFATIGNGWYQIGDSGWYIAKRTHRPVSQSNPDPLDGFIGQMTFNRPVAVVSDACHRAEGYSEWSLATLDGLVAALTEQQGWAEVTAPTDISIDGYAGKAFQRTAPAIISNCDGGDWSNSREDEPSWNEGLESWVNADDSSPTYRSGAIETLWVLDIDGTIVVISTLVMPGPSAGSPDFAADVLDSIRIEPA